LQYAHDHGLLHLDLKPSNVLLAADGQPMLLDFHLARGPIQPGDPSPVWLGGTSGYMAPEQQAALAAVRTGGPAVGGVDGRADVYALGVLLYEALGGALPAANRPAKTLSRINSRVPPGLADILAKCLQADPERRYRNAAALAADLRRHLADRPLQGVPNRSLAERWVKWRRRQPYTLMLLLPLLTSLAVGALAWTHVLRQIEQARAALQEGRDFDRQHQYEPALASLRRGLALVEGTPGTADLSRELRDEFQIAERARAAAELHRFVERLRGLSGSDALVPDQARAAVTRCGAFWERRDLIGRRLGEGPAGDEQQALADMLDLAIFWTDLRVRLADPHEVAATRREALAVLAEAEALFGPSRILCQERQAHAAALGLTSLAELAARQADALSPRSAWENCAVGRTFLRAGNVAAAAPWFERAVELQPQGLWPNFYKGKCAYLRGDHAQAVSSFTACVALAPESAWCYYNRGLAYAGLCRSDAALHDYDRALRLEPDFAAASLNRGMLHYQEKHYSEALADLQNALKAGAAPAAVSYNQALVHAARGDRTAALASLQRALQQDPGHREARSLQESLRQRP
jgi:tetratricopeptide (TPR) repeat protein